MKDKSGWIVLLFISVLLVSTSIPRVNAFTVIDHAMCKDVDVKTGECLQRTSEFQRADEEAYFWFRGTLETPDIGAKGEFKVYDPDGNLFVSPAPGAVMGAGDVVGWITIGVAKVGGIGFLGGWLFTAGPEWVKRASEKPGDWRAEFTLDGVVVVSERFKILGETATTTLGTVTMVTPVTEQEWVFDLGISQTWVTLKVIIHPGPGQSWDSWAFNLSPPNRFDKFAACGPNNESLTFNVEKDQSQVSVTVLFDESKQDGYYFYVKFLDTGQPFPAGSLLKADWSWTSADPVAHVVHLWLPERYAVSNLNIQDYAETSREGRVFVTFSGTAHSHDKFYWSLVVKQTTTTSTATVETLTGESPPGLTSNLLLILVVAVIVAVAVGYMYTRRKKPTSPTRSLKTSALFCVHCGAANPPLSKFCESCGQELLRP